MSRFKRVYQADLPHRAKMVYLYLQDRADVNGTCWPGIRTIAADLRLSRSTVKRALADLTRRGLIAVEPRWRENGSFSSNLYRLLQ